MSQNNSTETPKYPFHNQAKVPITFTGYISNPPAYIDPGAYGSVEMPDTDVTDRLLSISIDSTGVPPLALEITVKNEQATVSLPLGSSWNQGAANDNTYNFTFTNENEEFTVSFNFERINPDVFKGGVGEGGGIAMVGTVIMVR